MLQLDYKNILRILSLFLIIIGLIVAKIGYGCYAVESLTLGFILNIIFIKLFLPKSKYNLFMMIFGIIVSFVFLKGILQHCI